MARTASTSEPREAAATARNTVGFARSASRRSHLPRRARTASILAVAGGVAAAIAPSHAAPYTYEITTRGAIVADLGLFARTVDATYADARGWRRAGIAFRRVPVSAASDFTVVLAAADRMTSFSTFCSARYSCRVGRYVIVNQDRWRYGVRHWTTTLLAYRRMVVNHETGHWLGLGHGYCPAAAAVAPVMQQQSISLRGCRPNPWPKATEIRAVAFATILGDVPWVWWE
jgi:hypothetical protein